MSDLNETIRPAAVSGSHRIPVRARPSKPVVLGMFALLLAPVAGLAASAFEAGAIGSVDTEADPAGFLGAVTEHSGLWMGMSVSLLVMALLTMAWVPTVWHLTHRRSPGWAWAAAIVGALFALGQAVHLMSWAALTPAMAASIDPDAAAGVVSTAATQPFFLIIFSPFLLGAILAPLIAAIALWRARLLPLWSIAVVVAASGVMVVFGTEPPVGMIMHPLLWIVAFAPAAIRVLRRTDRGD